MLDLLDELRDGMLAGEISRSTLDQLTTLARSREEDFEDPGLTALVSEIELRALVELAKLDVAAARQA
jgi:hypothetical protein